MLKEQPYSLLYLITSFLASSTSSSIFAFHGDRGIAPSGVDCYFGKVLELGFFLLGDQNPCLLAVIELELLLHGPEQLDVTDSFLATAVAKLWVTKNLWSCCSVSGDNTCSCHFCQLYRQWVSN